MRVFAPGAALLQPSWRLQLQEPRPGADTLLLDFPPKRRQRGKDSLAIALGHQPSIQQGNDAGVLLGTQQPAAGLYQPQASIRYRTLHEGVAAVALYPLRQRRLHRIIRHGEGILAI